MQPVVQVLPVVDDNRLEQGVVGGDITVGLGINQRGVPDSSQVGRLPAQFLQPIAQRLVRVDVDAEGERVDQRADDPVGPLERVPAGARRTEDDVILAAQAMKQKGPRPEDERVQGDVVTRTCHQRCRCGLIEMPLGRAEGRGPPALGGSPGGRSLRDVIAVEPKPGWVGKPFELASEVYARRLRVELCKLVDIVSEFGIGARRPIGLRRLGIVSVEKRVEILQDEMECPPVEQGMVKFQHEQRCSR
jgi:hypothetical protein